MNLLNLVTNIEVRAMVAGNHYAITMQSLCNHYAITMQSLCNHYALSAAKYAYQLACGRLYWIGFGDVAKAKAKARGKRAVCFRNLRSAITLLGKEAA